eukprot:gene14303-biopygen12626
MGNGGKVADPAKGGWGMEGKWREMEGNGGKPAKKPGGVVEGNPGPKLAGPSRLGRSILAGAPPMRRAWCSSCTPTSCWPEGGDGD